MLFMSNELLILLLSALSLGFVHTLLGPDHYVPFIVLAKARKWKLPKTIFITTLCGVGHVLSAVLLGIIGISIGLTFNKFKFIESFRGDIAAWLLICFGLIYLIWSIRAIYRNKKHMHAHFHEDGKMHRHLHTHHLEHLHIHEKKKELAPWILFIIFILGPCEPLIPLIMYPAIKGSAFSVFLVTACFGLATILTMTFMVIVAVFGINFLRFSFLEKYGNVLAGSIICCSGLVIKFLGL
jgi:nickel/cobalt transporter (NicO) family protein